MDISHGTRLFDELDIWLNQALIQPVVQGAPRQEDTVRKNPKPERSQGSLSNQGLLTLDVSQLGPKIECDQESPENSPRPTVLEDPRREEAAEADWKNVPTVLLSNSQPDKIDQSMGRCNNSFSMSSGNYLG